MVASQASTAPEAPRGAHGAAPLGEERAALKIQDQQVQEAHQRLGQEIRSLDEELALMGKREDTVNTFVIQTTTYLRV